MIWLFVFLLMLATDSPGWLYFAWLIIIAGKLLLPYLLDD